jgi:hypothetical protein
MVEKLLLLLIFSTAYSTPIRHPSGGRSLRAESYVACKHPHPLLPNTGPLIAPTEIKLAIFAIQFADTNLPTHDEIREFYLGGVAAELLSKWSMGCLQIEAEIFSVTALQNERDETGSCHAEQGLDDLDLSVDFGENTRWPDEYYGTVALLMKQSCTSAAFTGDLAVGSINGEIYENSFYGIFTSDHAWQLNPPYKHTGSYGQRSNWYGRVEAVSARGVATGINAELRTWLHELLHLLGHGE